MSYSVFLPGDTILFLKVEITINNIRGVLAGVSAG